MIELIQNHILELVEENDYKTDVQVLDALKLYAFQVRQITITIRTIVNGLTYLATFVFGLNSLGLFLYSGQLAIKSIMGGSTEKETENKSTDQPNLSNPSVESPEDNTELSCRKEEQSSNDAQ